MTDTDQIENLRQVVYVHLSSCTDRRIGSKVTTDVATKLWETTKVQNYLHITLKLNEKFVIIML